MNILIAQTIFAAKRSQCSIEKFPCPNHKAERSWDVFMLEGKKVVRI
jgi:hypothetical protein